MSAQLDKPHYPFLMIIILQLNIFNALRTSQTLILNNFHNQFSFFTIMVQYTTSMTMPITSSQSFNHNSYMPEAQNTSHLMCKSDTLPNESPGSPLEAISTLDAHLAISTKTWWSYACTHFFGTTKSFGSLLRYNK